MIHPLSEEYRQSRSFEKYNRFAKFNQGLRFEINGIGILSKG